MKPTFASEGHHVAVPGRGHHRQYNGRDDQDSGDGDQDGDGDRQIVIGDYLEAISDR